MYIAEISGKGIKGKFGAKGEKLYELAKAGFRVPLTYGLIEEAYSHFAANNSLTGLTHESANEKKSRERIGERKLGQREDYLPDEIQNELFDRIFKEKPNAKWAVRSSSNQEDLSNASFAGLYDTFLNVEGIENLLDAIKKCWASLWSERAIQYREAKGLSHSQATMAVLIQEMVPAIYSGVIFTADPVTQDKNRMLLEYCPGLGDQLVSGRITPFSSAIDKSSLAVQRLNHLKHEDLPDAEILSLARTAMEIEKHFNGPQDIEWAFDGRKFFILQTRPITASKEDEKIRLADIWTRANVGEVLPDAVTPLTWSVFCGCLLGEASRAGENGPENSVKLSTGIDLMQGRVYIRSDKFLDSFCYLPFVNASVLEKALGVILPPNAERYEPPQGLKVRLAQALFLINALRLWPRISNLIKFLPALPGESISEAQELMSWTSRWFAAHLKCTAYAMGAFGVLSHLLEKWIPEKQENLLPQLLIGDGNLQTATQGISLRGLAKFVSTEPELKDFFQSGTIEWGAIQKIHSLPGGAEFLKLFEKFMEKNGARTAGEFELAIPRWREDPSFPLEIVRRFLRDESPEGSGIDMEKRRRDRDKILAEIRKDLKPWQKWLLDRMLASYCEFSTLRENVKYRLIEGFGLLRDHFLKLGGKLAERGTLSSKEDIFFLIPGEIDRFLLEKTNSGEAVDLVASRKAEWTMWRSQPAPDLIAGGYQVWEKERGIGLKGVGCSPGIAEGIARVLFDDSKARDLIPGEILVAPHTDPGWTPLFLICKGLVTETGGFLSHGATVAREYGVPAVTSVAGATEKISTGDLIRVDGENGLVTICQRKGLNSLNGNEL